MPPILALDIVRLLRPTWPSNSADKSIAPAKNVISYQTVQFNDGFGNDTTPYQGLPTDELDALWEDMYDRMWYSHHLHPISQFLTLHIGGIGLHLSPDEVDLDQLPKDTEKVPLSGLEDQFLIGLDVFHQLHCLVRGKVPKASR